MKGVQSHMDIIRYVNNGKTLRFNCVEGSDKFEHAPIIEGEIISLPNSCENLQCNQYLRNYPGYLDEDVRQQIESDRGMLETKNQQGMTFQQSQQYMQNSQYVETPVQSWQSQQDSVPTVPIEERRSVGLLLKDAYELNKYEEKSQIDAKIRIAEYSGKKAVDQSFKEDGRTNEAQNRIAVSSNALENNQENESRTITNDEIKNIALEFIHCYALVTVRVQGQINRVYTMRSSKYNRHIYVDKNYIREKYIEFVENNLPENVECPKPMTLEKEFQRMFYYIDKLEYSGLKVLKNYQVMFLNGYWDIKTNYVYPVEIEERNLYFNTYSIEINLPSELFPPKAFSLFLCDMLDTKTCAVDIAYEMIGAMLTPLPLKTIFVFQGKSKGGKSRLARIIQGLFMPDAVYPIDSLSQIADERIMKPSEMPINLIYLDELGRNKLTAEQIKQLKIFSSGSDRLGVNPKILISTNYGIYTSDGIIEPALKNRLAVLSFPKIMENVDRRVANFEKNHLEAERDTIIYWSLYNFHLALKKNHDRDYPFSYKFSINSCIEDNSVVNSELTPNELQSIDQAINNPSQPNTSNESKSKNSPTFFNAPQKISDKNEKLLELLRENFERTDKEEEYLMADTVLQIIEELMPGTNGKVQNVGKTVKAVFGDDCSWSRRKDNKTWYKIKRKL